jgi:hypothetical protein
MSMRTCVGRGDSRTGERTKGLGCADHTGDPNVTAATQNKL